MNEHYNTTMVVVTAIVCMAYGLAFPILRMTPETQPVLFWAGAAVCAALFVPFILMPFLRSLNTRRD